MTPPHLHVIRGDATSEDIAALLAIFAVAQSHAKPPEATAIHAWNARNRMIRTFPVASPGAWRASGLAQ